MQKSKVKGQSLEREAPKPRAGSKERGGEGRESNPLSVNSQDGDGVGLLATSPLDSPRCDPELVSARLPVSTRIDRGRGDILATRSTSASRLRHQAYPNSKNVTSV
jgi:hypothetical protein